MIPLKGGLLGRREIDGETYSFGELFYTPKNRKNLELSVKEVEQIKERTSHLITHIKTYDLHQDLTSSAVELLLKSKK